MLHSAELRCCWIRLPDKWHISGTGTTNQASLSWDNQRFKMVHVFVDFKVLATNWITNNVIKCIFRPCFETHTTYWHRPMGFLTMSQNSKNWYKIMIVEMKALSNILKTVSASDEFKSTFKVCSIRALPDHMRRDPKSAVERSWRHGEISSKMTSRVLLVSLFLCGVCMLSVLCFVFVSDRNKYKLGFKRSCCENTLRVCFQPLREKDERIPVLLK